jgi:SAM-dependent methyltransferase
MSDSPPTAPTDGYALGRSDAETRRLILQHQIYGPITRQFFLGAGIGAGMRVLELGCGAGDVVLLLAELVGPEGNVVGVDMNAGILDRARARVEAAGWGNVDFRHGDLAQLTPGEQFDAVVGRWVLMYVPEPAALLAQAREWLRPGGLVAFQEGDIRSAVRTFPAAPFHETAVRWTTPPPGAPGPDVDMGLKLFSTFIQAGLPAPRMRLDAPIGGGPSWPGYEYLANTLRSLLPFLEHAGAVSPGEVDIDSVEEGLREEVVDSNGVQILPPLIGAWSHTR